MRKITGEEDFKLPILLFFSFSMLFIPEASEAVKNFEAQGTSVLSNPILFTGNPFETLSRFCWFLIPAALVYEAVKERDLFLKLTYFIGSVPLVLTTTVIKKLGFEFLHLAKVLILLAVIMCLMKYLINTTDRYKKAIKENIKSDNPAASVDGEKARRS